MAVRPKDKAGKKWQIDYYPQGRKGKRVMQYFHGNQADAIAYETSLRRGSSIDIPVSPKIIDAIPDWKKDYQNNHRPTTYIDVVCCLKHLTPFFGHTKFSMLTPTLIEQYKSARLETGVSKRTINKELSYFSGLCKWAAENNYAHPLSFRIKKFPRIKAPQPVIPHPSMIKKLIDNIEPIYLPIFLLLYDGGLRLTEATHLKAQNVFIDTGMILVRGKGGKERLVPIMTGRLRDELARALQKRQDGYLYINPKTGRPWRSIRKALLRAATRAGVKQKINHHLLRHSFGTHGLASGMNLRALQGIMGHSSSKTTEIYTHLLGDYLKTEGQKFDHYIGKLNDPQPLDSKKK